MARLLAVGVVRLLLDGKPAVRDGKGQRGADCLQVVMHNDNIELVNEKKVGVARLSKADLGMTKAVAYAGHQQDTIAPMA